jgi:hypothetical protein
MMNPLSKWIKGLQARETHRAFLCAAAILFLSVPMKAQDVGYVGLYTDSLHSCYEHWSSNESYDVIDMYLWCLPPSQGMQGVWFKLGSPPTAVHLLSVEFPDDTWMSGGILSDWTAGWHAVVSSCRHDWTWFVKWNVWITSYVTGSIELEPEPIFAYLNGVAFMDCSGVGSYNFYGARTMTNLEINRHGELSVENTTWSAIKALYR